MNHPEILTARVLFLRSLRGLRLGKPASMEYVLAWMTGNDLLWGRYAAKVTEIKNGEIIAEVPFPEGTDE